MVRSEQAYFGPSFVSITLSTVALHFPSPIVILEGNVFCFVYVNQNSCQLYLILKISRVSNLLALKPASKGI